MDNAAHRRCQLPRHRRNTDNRLADCRFAPANELISTVERNVDEIEYKNGILEIENDFAFFVDEVYCNVFDSSGRYIDGESPAALINSKNLKNGEVGTFETDGNKYYYYDTRLDFNKYEYEIDAFSGKIIKYEADTAMSGSATRSTKAPSSRTE